MKSDFNPFTVEANYLQFIVIYRRKYIIMLTILKCTYVVDFSEAKNKVLAHSIINVKVIDTVVHTNYSATRAFLFLR